jgi:hypothetical protein
MGELSVTAAILLVFHLYLLVRPERIKRKMCLTVGLGGLLLMLVGNFFLIGGHGGLMIVSQIFTVIGLLGAFGGGVGACFPGELPFVETGTGAGQRQGSGPQA